MHINVFENGEGKILAIIKWKIRVSRKFSGKKGVNKYNNSIKIVRNI